MKILGLLRHAKSDWGDSDRSDFDRGLNERGLRGAALIGEHIKGHGIKWERLLASPAHRVKRTLEQALPEMEPEYDRQLYLASADTICEVLAGIDGDPSRVIVSGHNPGLQDTILMLVARDQENDLFDEAKVKFPTASYAVLELDIERWEDIRPECGKIAYFARPRDLDADLGPEA
ncbi:SixA phosphatase family protein [Qipengyuania atrilutea]|uniref:Histidine phosphatase family protein n=1 Tax=Qipengyuania atrilutea TaxID=2744473 RepID=A0A850H6U4_9SPHN|nr:histidine phosphatase family protein [Actirhodobacter atriluteus]NVD45568.1 histidine phosphatase family protein [Actirhodobacter atriluteus]